MIACVKASCVPPNSPKALIIFIFSTHRTITSPTIMNIHEIDQVKGHENIHLVRSIVYNDRVVELVNNRILEVIESCLTVGRIVS